MNDTITVKDRATVVEAIAAYRTQQSAVTRFAEEHETFLDQLAKAFSIAIDGETLDDAPASLTPQVRGEADAIVAQLETLADEMQVWLDGLGEVTYDDTWLEVMDRRRTAAEAAIAHGDAQLAEAHLLAALNAGPDGLTAEYAIHAARTAAALAPLDGALSDVTSVAVPEHLVRGTVDAAQRITRLEESVNRAQDASRDLKQAADTWQQTAPKADELNTAEDGDPALYGGLVEQRRVATTEFFSTLRTTAEKVRIAA